MPAPKRSQKRQEKIGTRLLTNRSLLAAFNDTAHNLQLGPFVVGEPKATTLKRARAVEHHVILHQQREVATILRKLADAQNGPGSAWIRAAASRLKTRWTIPNPT